MISGAEKQFIEGLLLEVPEFKDTYEDHVQFNGEILPIVLMDEFSRFVLEHFRRAMASSTLSNDIVTRALNYLESELEQGNETAEVLIRTTFSESVDAEWRDKDFFNALWNRCGPKLRKTISAASVKEK